MTPEERRERWVLFEERYGPIPQPPDVPEEILDLNAWQRYVWLFRFAHWSPWNGRGQG